MKKTKHLILGIAVLASAASVLGNQYDYGDKPYTIQALLGGIRYDGLEFTSSDGTDSVTMDMSTLPQLGGAWSTLPKGERLQFGLEATFLLGFKFDDVNTYNGVHNVYVTASSSLWMFDIAGGAYANLTLGDKLRVYAAAGPLVMLGIYSSSGEYAYLEQSETSFGYGAYARGGVELQVRPRGWLGAGVRGNWSSIDFSDVGGSSEISGAAVFVTYTAGL